MEKISVFLAYTRMQNDHSDCTQNEPIVLLWLNFADKCMTRLRNMKPFIILLMRALPERYTANWPNTFNSSVKPYCIVLIVQMQS